MKSRIIKNLFAVALMAPVMAFAVPIDGSIRMGGDASPGCSAEGVDCNLGSADSLIFGTSFVVGADGDFAPALGASTLNGTLNLTDFTIDPFSGPVTIWQIFGSPAEGGQPPLFTFSLDSLDILTQTAGQLILRGTGIVSADGFDDTAGRWSFSAQDLRGSRQINFSWSSETTQAPEPGILMLLGLGVLGLIRLRRS
ncbi:MAG: PEP-CTERM sorting domain-containing protein [Gammaproteobacteria bacterium]|nr:PEP-CTERM sorting domain-containing protein [Gammaproteobacteria bacterium]